MISPDSHDSSQCHFLRHQETIALTGRWHESTAGATTTGTGLSRIPGGRSEEDGTSQADLSLGTTCLGSGVARRSVRLSLSWVRSSVGISVAPKPWTRLRISHSF